MLRPNPEFSSFSLSGGATGAPVVSNDVFQTMGGQTLVFSGDANGPDFTAPPMEFVPTFSFADIFRFDIDQSWISQRWERVSTSAGENGLRGLRVALVTGTNIDDLHGSLTYYFDDQQRVQRITFRGYAGDSTRLVQLLTDKFGFKLEKSRLAGLYLARKFSGPASGLVLKDPTVIRADNPTQRVAMALELNNPKSWIGMSPSFQAIVANAQKLKKTLCRADLVGQRPFVS